MFQWCAILVLLLAAFPSIKSQCITDPKDPCSANCNGTVLSIKNALQYPIVLSPADTGSKYNYTFSPCSGTDCGLADHQKDNAVCQGDPQSTGISAYSLGKVAGAVWTYNASSDPMTFTIAYSGGDDAGNNKRSSVVTFTIGDTGLKYNNENEGISQYFFTVTAPSGTYTSGVPGDVVGGIGLGLIFLAIGAFIAYFVIGGLVMYFVKGARGVEVIPNYTFWKDFPFLLKDAMLFIVSPCYKRASYDKI